MTFVEGLYRWSIQTLTTSDRSWQTLYAQLVQDHAGRAYHNWEHVVYVVGMASLLSSRVDVDESTWARIAFALFNHDRVYDPTRTDNEERSAAKAYTDLPDEEVRRLILLTRDHRASDLAGSIVADADLSILGAPSSLYADYMASIRREYGHLSDQSYRDGRLVFLQRTLYKAERRVLFHSDLLDNDRAIDNLRAEIASL